MPGFEIIPGVGSTGATTFGHVHTPQISLRGVVGQWQAFHKQFSAAEGWVAEWGRPGVGREVHVKQALTNAGYVSGTPQWDIAFRTARLAYNCFVAQNGVRQDTYVARDRKEIAATLVAMVQQGLIARTDAIEIAKAAYYQDPTPAPVAFSVRNQNAGSYAQSWRYAEANKAAHLQDMLQAHMWGFKVYTVMPGDNLTKIARNHGVPSYMTIFNMNPQLLLDPNDLNVGFELILPVAKSN